MSQHNPPGALGRGTPTGPDNDPDARELRVEIEQTRTEMTGTIDEIQQRLDPQVLTGQAKDAAQDLLEQAVREVKDAALEVTEHAVHEVKEAAREVTGDAKDAAWEATVGRAEHAVGATVAATEEAVSSVGQTAKGVSSIVIDTIKQNPMPAALAGISLAWLYMKRSSGQTAYSVSRDRGPYQAYPSSAVYGRGSSSATQGQGVVSSVADTVGGAVSSAGDVASDVVSSAGQMASDAASSAGQMASSAGETAMDTGSTLAALIRQNPVPATLIGIGLGWLYLNRSSGQPDYRAHSGSHRLHETSTGAYTSDPDDGVKGMTRQAGDKVGELAGNVQEQAGEIGGAALDRAQRAPGKIQRMVDENPLTAAALAATVGGAVGLAMPPTQREDRILGSTRDRFMGQAEKVTRETTEKVQNVAQEVQTTVKKEAQAQGLTV
jgi:hypothetical protein